MMINIQQNILDVNRTWQDGLVLNETRARTVKKEEEKKKEKLQRNKQQKSKHQNSTIVYK